MKKIAMLVLLPLAVNADMITPSHDCVKPARPSQFASDAERVSLQRQSGAYKQCLRDFINAQNKEARMHSEAARMASNELKQSGY